MTRKKTYAKAKKKRAQDEPKELQENPKVVNTIGQEHPAPAAHPALAIQWQPPQHLPQHPDHRGSGEDGAGRAHVERPGDQEAARPEAPPARKPGTALAIQWQDHRAKLSQAGL